VKSVVKIHLTPNCPSYIIYIKLTESHKQKSRKQDMADTRIKQHHHPKASPLLLFPCALPPLCPCALVLLVPQWLCGRQSIMQNKANFKMGKMTISTAAPKAYANKQRTMNNEPYPKQTQTNPIQAQNSSPARP